MKHSSIKRRIPALLAVAALATATAGGIVKNGFKLDNSLIPSTEILSGGPPRDGIPAIDRPSFVTAREDTFLSDSDRVLGITLDGISKAYPIAILNWHEIVNDHIGNQAVVISFCPLCGSGVAFSAAVAGGSYTFGVSGLLYNSDVLLYDRQTESLWSQLLGKAISGPLRGAELTQLALTQTTWRDWKSRHPETLTLSTATGYRRDYHRDPYAGYTDSNGLFFPVRHRDPRYHPKEQVLGLIIDGKAKAYPFAELARNPGDFTDSIAGQRIRITFDAEHRNATAHDLSGREIPSTIAFWFAWIAFHPDTDVFKAAR